MRLRTLSLLFFFALVAAFTVSQVNVTEAHSGSPLSSPITFANHVLSGHVKYKFLGWRKAQVEKTSPAGNVTVEATNKKTDEVFTAQTDLQGYFLLNLPKGTYTVKASDSLNTEFKPDERNVNLNKDKQIKFTGVINLR